jgi:nucleoside-triphosphatase
VDSKLLISGPPGVGKTTLIIKLAERLVSLRPVGFYTEEIRERGTRKGFRLVSLPDGKTALLSHVDIKSSHRVGKYGVDIEGFERFMDGIPFDKASLVVIDEIGKMECISERFRNMINKLLHSRSTLVATVARKGTPYIEGIKKSPGARLIELDLNNRETVLEEIIAALSK